MIKVSDDDGTGGWYEDDGDDGDQDCRRAAVLVMSGGLTRDPARHVEAFFTESNNSASCFLPDLPADRNFNTLDYIEGKLVLCGGDGERQNLLVSIVMHLNIFPTHKNIFPY